VPGWFDSIPQFDELYSVSDLHMGGDVNAAEPSPQIFNSSAELAKLIGHLKERPGKVALVINGDMVDFLAEPGATAFDAEGAVNKLTRIAKDPAFAPVWRALTEFVGAEQRRLVITLGNHDLELALPWVREHLLDLLAGKNDAARGRIVLAFDGAGFLCRVGNATVLCVHGNEVDDWNLTNHEALRRAGRDMQRGRAATSWAPNAGTRLVIDVMNDVKKHYPFVDLLKPEKEAVLPVLGALAPRELGQYVRTARALNRLVVDKFRRAVKWLGTEDQVEFATVAEDIVGWRPPVNGEALMEAAESRLAQGVEPISLVPEEDRVQQLGIMEAAATWAYGGEPREVLRARLSDLIADRSFEWTREDDTFRKLDEKVAPDVDFILAGHTHLERAIPRRGRSGFYFNSGTWVRLIRLKPEVLADQTEFNKVYGVLSAGTMQALDECDLVLHRCTVVAVRPDPTGTRGELLHWDTSGATPELKRLDALAGMTKKA
jgi:UDP-2,3-diacylglucosamine pyrophosphatase LpxH